MPAIALTGFGRAGDERQALAAGFTAHLAKPVALDALFQTVRRIFRSDTQAGVEGTPLGG